MMVFLTGLAAITSLVTCDVLRVLNPDKPLPRAAAYATAALLSVAGVSVVAQLMRLL
ncbi:hypothetical protein [Arthrobacter sp. UYEF20]|uniref:hypothetical protein n=1 Tax=Arthrobacter sp. UYEF20 TaxID=1756363 RepID=UPI00339954DB